MVETLLRIAGNQGEQEFPCAAVKTTTSMYTIAVKVHRRSRRFYDNQPPGRNRKPAEPTDRAIHVPTEPATPPARPSVRRHVPGSARPEAGPAGPRRATGWRPAADQEMGEMGETGDPTPET